MANKPDMMLWLSDARGQYIPRDFALSFKDRAKSVSGVSDEDWAILEAGPDDDSHTLQDSVQRQWQECEPTPIVGPSVNEWYWETWSYVEQNAIITDENGVKFRVYQDGDCWLIPEGMEWNEETDSFEWPTEESD